MKKKDIIQMYRDWRKANGNQKPNRVIVKMRWDDEDGEDINTEKGYQVDTIGIVPANKLDRCLEYEDDFMILFYVSSLNGLFSLMTPDNGSDFTVLEVLEFWKLK